LAQQTCQKRRKPAPLADFFNKLLGIALQGWQLTGIWRAARKHTQRGGRRIWAFLAQLGVILGWVVWSGRLRGAIDYLSGVSGN
jgi:hypothetical protein